MADSGISSGFSAFRDNIRSPALRVIADHWHTVRGKRRIPSWADLKPSLLGEHLSSVWGFDYDRGAGLFTGRLAGSNIMVGVGRSFLGTALSDLHPPHVFTVVHDYFTRTVSEPACCRWSGKLFRIESQTIDGERIVLPMGADAESANGVLGASWYDYPVWRTPDRLELIHDQVEWCAV